MNHIHRHGRQKRGISGSLRACSLRGRGREKGEFVRWVEEEAREEQRKGEEEGGGWWWWP